MANTDEKIKPKHYQEGPYEPINIIDHYNLNFNAGNVLKYALRAGQKEGEEAVDDWGKAAYYAAREFKRLKALKDAV